MKFTRRRVSIVLGAVLALAYLAYLIHAQPGAPQVFEQSIQPEYVRPVGFDGDPLAPLVGFQWTQDGFCVGQFHAHAAETPTEVKVSAVISRTYREGACAGV